MGEFHASAGLFRIATWEDSLRGSIWRRKRWRRVPMPAAGMPQDFIALLYKHGVKDQLMP
jgi:hypothetical protein